VTSQIGVAAFGGYIPPLRLNREEVAAAHKWVNPGLRSLAQGTRAVAGWDEDVVTMAVDAARDCFEGVDRASVGGLVLGTTTAPFADRLNSGIIADALGIRETATLLDVTGSRRAGTSALRAGFDAAAARGEPVLVVAAERGRSPAATSSELTSGHAAAALLLAPGPGIARLLGSASLSVDFVDHFR
jgi:3-hydroxy-3-methylglutaryl CoA synthase